MKTVSTKPTKRTPESDDALQFVEHGRRSDAAPNLRERLKAFYLRHPLRALKRGERGIVESLKADRDRR
jgi:hypothetical protein